MKNDDYERLGGSGWQNGVYEYSAQEDVYVEIVLADESDYNQASRMSTTEVEVQIFLLDNYAAQVLSECEHALAELDSGLTEKTDHKVPGGMWLKEMAAAVKELKGIYIRIEEEEDPDVDALMTGLKQRATESMRTLKEWSDLPFLSYTYWSLMEETEKCVAIVEKTRSEEAMLRTQVLTGWLYAVKDRIEELGGRIEV